MTSFNVDAHLFRVAAMFQSTEETRFYLQGVLIEPHHEKGVFLVTTDGHRMFVAHDESGSADGQMIVRLGKDQLKSCQTGRGEDSSRRLHADDAKLPAYVSARGEHVALMNGWQIDGQFPDWRRAMKGANSQGGAVEGFDARLMASFANASKELGGTTSILVETASDSGPALIRFGMVDNAVGCLMPVRWKGETGFAKFLGFEPNPPAEQATEAA